MRKENKCSVTVDRLYIGDSLLWASVNVTNNGCSVRYRLSGVSMAILIACRIKANDGLKLNDVPRRFRSIPLGVPATTKDYLPLVKKKNNNRFVLTDEGKAVLEAVLNNDKMINNRRYELPLRAIKHKVGRKQFYNIFYLVNDSFCVIRSRKFGPIERLAYSKLYKEAISDKNILPE